MVIYFHTTDLLFPYEKYGLPKSRILGPLLIASAKVELRAHWMFLLMAVLSMNSFILISAICVAIMKWVDDRLNPAGAQDKVTSIVMILFAFSINAEIWAQYLERLPQ